MVSQTIKTYCQERMTMPVVASPCELVTRSADTIFNYENNLLFSLA